MQGKRTDLKYDIIVDYIKKYEPISISDFNTYLKEKHGIENRISRSRLIKRLEELKRIKRIGTKNGNNNSTFVTIK